VNPLLTPYLLNQLEPDLRACLAVVPVPVCSRRLVDVRNDLLCSGLGSSPPVSSRP